MTTLQNYSIFFEEDYGYTIFVIIRLWWPLLYHGMMDGGDKSHWLPSHSLMLMFDQPLHFRHIFCCLSSYPITGVENSYK